MTVVLTTGSASPRQIAAIHAMAKSLGLDDATYRAALESATGKRSARDLTGREAAAVLDQLGALPGAKGASKGVRGAIDVDGPYAGKLRALWISAWHLGVVRDRTDAAMASFVERQTGLARTRWLRTAADARKAVEALKSWIAREGDVDWPTSDDPIALRLAVIEAQRRRLTALGATLPPVPAADADAAALDDAIRAHGAVLRRALKRSSAR